MARAGLGEAHDHCRLPRGSCTIHRATTHCHWATANCIELLLSVSSYRSLVLSYLHRATAQLNLFMLKASAD
eukprot:1853557-Lingulodinium_polyedra.AAC.1